MGLAYVTSEFKRRGWQVDIYNQDVYHYPEEHLTEYLESQQYDVVGVGMCAGYYQHKKLLKLRKAIPQNIEFWLGGHIIAGERDYFKSLGLYPVEGEVDSIDSMPAWDAFPIDYYSLIRLPHAENKDRCFPVLSGRGCPYRCTFCYRMTPGYRQRDIQKIKEEIQILKSEYHISYIDFADELFMVSPKRTFELCKMLEPLNVKWMCNGRLNIARTDILKAMKEAGCVFISYGVESVDDDVLEKMNKKLTYKQIVEGTENTLRKGISPRLNMIWGNLGDTEDTLQRSVNFLLDYDDHTELRTIRPVTPYPGSDLYYYAIKQGLLSGIDDFYKKHINSDLATIQFTGLSNEEFHQLLGQVNATLVEEYYNTRNDSAQIDMAFLYSGRDDGFRGFRQT